MKARGVLFFATLALVIAFAGACVIASEKPIVQDVTQKAAPVIGAGVLPYDVPLPSSITVSPPPAQIHEK